MSTPPPEPPKLAQVLHFELYGKREEKYDFLRSQSLRSVSWKTLELAAPQFFFAVKDFSLQKEYEKGFSIQELFPVNSLGLITKRDNLSIAYSETEQINKISFFLDQSNSIDDVCEHFGIPLKDNDRWNALNARNTTKTQDVKKHIEDILYRPLDRRKVFYNDQFVARLNKKVLGHLQFQNLAIIIGRQGQVVGGNGKWNIIFITDSLTDQNVFYRGGGTVFPLYVYPLSNGLYTGSKRVPNLNQTIVAEISKRIGEKVAPLDLLDYIYAVLHSPSYRERYKEFLKIDFPRVPYPDDAELFRRYAALGSKLRRLHLVDGVVPLSGLGDFPVMGENELERLQYSGGKVFINSAQYFGNVPAEVWNFYIGGYQPAQKWLKDRKGRKLNFNEIEHYQKIVRILKETGEIMLEIDKIA